MPTEGKGPIVIPCYLVDGVPYVLEVDAAGKLAVRAAEIETLLAGGLPAALDSGALKVKEQSPLSGFATSANQTTIITALQLIDDLRNALLTVATDRLGVRATEIETLLGAGLPVALDSLALKVKEQSPLSGFATSAKQDTMITALQLIDDLRAALGSVNTDDLQVDVKTMPTVTVQAAGGDKLISMESIVEESVTNGDLSAGNPLISGTAVPAGKIWIITTVNMEYSGTSPTSMYAYADGLASGLFLLHTLLPTSGFWYVVHCNTLLQAGDKIALQIIGATLHDNATLRYAGYQMDAP